MREINTGNSLPFYKIGLKSNDVHSPTIDHSVGGTFNLVPFEVILPSSSNGGGFDFILYNATGSVAIPLIVTETPFTSTLSAYTYSASVTLPLTNCAMYRIYVINTSSVALYESEWIQIRPTANWNYHFFFTNGTDIGNVFYQDGYTQQLHFDGFEDAPLVDSVRKTEITLNGREKTTSSRQVARRVIIGHNFVRSQMAAVKGMEQHGTITMFENGEAMGVQIENLVVTISNTEDKLFDAQLVFDVNIAAKTGCGENIFVKL